jgi:ABC-type phosphate transport system substrate-binding protein
MQTAHAEEAGFQVIVNTANNLDTIDQKFLAEAFLKKKTYWPDMRVIQVVDLESSSQVRRLFSEQILDRPVSAVRNYWQQILFSGRGVPPPEFKTEQEALNFVASHANAIGYVSNFADLHLVKVLKVQ